MSLYGISKGDNSSDRAPTALAIVLKSVVHPVLAWFFAVAVFQLDSFSVFAVTVCAILPTGQNVVLYAVRYGVAHSVAHSASLVTTVLAVPVLLGVALLLN